ncbi:uncharacterized protein [Panulirus ornatus]|uniref:uncharacterized protein n=1 Tax=Panulirus ornatus TaxID=150431 RepID=UPI003A8BB35D
MDNNGGCVLVEQEKLHHSMNVPRDKFSFDKFRNMCILSGCDYLPSLHGIGLAKACKFFSVISNPDIHSVLCKLPSYLKMPQLEVTQEYRDGFIKARNTFLYQLVFDPIDRILRPLNDYPDGNEAEDFPYAGKFIGHKQALQIALGNVNVQTGEIVNHFSPDTSKPTEPKSSSWNKYGDISSAHPSIWTKTFTKKGPVVPNIMTPERQTMRGKEVTVSTSVLNRRKPEPEVNDGDPTEGDLQNMYCQPKKCRKVEASLDNTEESHDECAIPSSTDQSSDSHDTEYVTDMNLSSSVDKENDTSLETHHSPYEQKKSRNPFAKSHTAIRLASSSGEQFSALKKFSKIKKTVVDQTSIIHSRYFAPPAVETSPTPGISAQVIMKSPAQSTAESEGHSQKLNVKEQKIVDNNLEIKLPIEDCPLETPKALLSSVQSNTVPKKNNTTFQWRKLSEMYSYTETKSMKIEGSPATKSAFKFVNQQKTESSKEDTETLSQNLDNEELCSFSQRSCLSELSSCSDVGSLDNESFCLTPSSLPSTPEAGITTALQEAMTLPSVTTSLVQHRGTVSGIRNQKECRRLGLSRSVTTKNKKQIGAKQLNLKDMFGYKKDQDKLPVRPLV